MSKYGNKWEISRTSIDRLIEKAKPIATDISKRADKTIADTRDAQLKDAAKNGLKSVIEIDLKLQKIIFDSFSRINKDGKFFNIENSASDQIRAIDIYYKRHGYYETDNKQKGMPQSITINGRVTEF